ncbi:MAG TPA: amino acid permease [Thermoanaerobaculia bacterium]|nr:amino acid permease [Thermoanaerobaculia bacterium]
MSQQPGSHPHGAELARELGLFDAINLVIGTIIGSGIFLVPSEIARAVWTPGWMLAVWVIGGVLTMLGALSLAELGAAMPEAGGIYSFITRAFGRLPGFLCGWMLFTVATSGSIATLAAAFPIYLGAFVPLNPTTSKVAGVVAVAVLTWINAIGVKNGARVGNVLTALKVGGLILMVAVIFILPGPTQSASAAAAAAAPSLPAGTAPMTAVGVALVAVLWAYEGWHDVSFAAGEMQNPQKNFPRAVIGGVAIVIGLYLLANLAYLKILSPAEIAATDKVALLAMTRVTGEWGGKVLTAAILCSMLGAMNALILAGPRAYYQMARDKLFFERVSRVHPRWRTPVESLVFQGLWSTFLVLFIGGFSQLFTYVIFGGWIFYALAVLSVVVLRRKEPGLVRPFRVPGYPVVPILFALTAGAIVVNTLIQTPRESLLGLAFIALGIPVYWIQSAVRRRARAG